EAEFLEEHERQPPFAAFDRLAAIAATRAAGRRALGACEPRQPPVLDAFAGDALEMRRFLGGRGVERLEQRLGALVRGARQVKPERHLAVAERVRLPLAEPQGPFLDRLTAAAALRAAARGGLDDMRHRPSSLPVTRAAAAACASRSPARMRARARARRLPRAAAR